MRNNKLVQAAAIAAVSALALSACGSRKAASGSSTGGATGGAANITVEIGVDSPTTGDLAALGIGIKNSSELAINKANKTNEVPGVTFVMVAKDDKADDSVGGDNANAFVADPKVLGVVGPLNSHVALREQPILCSAKLVQVSPANTNVALTQGPDWNAGTLKRPCDSYFRTATTDAIQGPFAADYLYNTAKITSVYTVDDKKAYGDGLDKTFTAEFTKLGGKVLGHDTVNPGDKDFSAVVQKIKASGAGAVYYGGEYPEAGPLSDQMKSGGANIPLMGGDGIKDKKFVSLANGKGTGDLSTSVGVPVEQLDTAKQFIADYKAAGYKDEYAAYGGYSYDSAWAIIEAVKTAMAGGKTAPTRDAVAAAMAKVSFSGVTGTVSFDQYGDATNKQLTVYKVTGDDFAPVISGTFPAKS